MEGSTVPRRAFPPLLREIADPPHELYLLGTLPDPKEHHYIAVIGTRKHSHYGADACEKIIADLARDAAEPIVIVSGLALGVDGIAHRAALEVDLPTVAVPGSGLDESVLHPHSHRELARQIVKAGGALVSEYPWTYPASIHTFPERNRIIAGLSRAVLVIEARHKSGALITARLALDYNRDVFAIPGSIFSETAEGSNRLIAQGAVPVTCGGDMLRALGIPTREEGGAGMRDLSPTEQAIYNVLAEPMTTDDLIRALARPAHEIIPALMTLEVDGIIRASGDELRRAY